MKASKPEDVNIFPVGFNITSILTDSTCPKTSRALATPVAVMHSCAANILELKLFTRKNQNIMGTCDNPQHVRPVDLVTSHPPTSRRYRFVK